MGPMHMDRAHSQQGPLRNRDEAAVPPPSVAYSLGPMSHEPGPRMRRFEDSGTPTQASQRNLLAVQEMNRKGRISPLPQAVQGAQPQLAGPAGEPGIKSEFGRMFSGIGTGVGTLSSPVPAGAQLAYTNTGLIRQDDAEAAPEPPVETTKAPGRGKRRKLKEEDEEGSAAPTPAGGRAKKPKGHHHHQYVHLGVCDTAKTNISSHHHHHHHHNLEQGPSPAVQRGAAFRNVKGSTPVASPTGMAKDLPGGHHHHHHHHHAPLRSQPNARPVPPPRSPSPIVLPKPSQVISSRTVLESVADRPRLHLGDVVYEVKLKQARQQDARTGRPPRSGYKSTPVPLPWALIEGKENSTLTMKIGKEHLAPAAREEITSRRALWGTDVYTDDSDVIAACIHAGWIRGEWPEEVDITMLGLDQGYSASDVRNVIGGQANGKGAKLQPQLGSSGSTSLTEPPKDGPMPVPENRDLHVTLLILPRLDKYASTTRFGIKSREFGGPTNDEDPRQRAVHDGVSFMVVGLQWVTNGGAPQNRLRGKARRERIRKALAEVEMTPAWISRPLSGTGCENRRDDRDTRLGWWGQNTSRSPSEGDKENLDPVGKGKKVAKDDQAEEEGQKSAEKEQEPEAAQEAQTEPPKQTTDNNTTPVAADKDKDHDETPTTSEVAKDKETEKEKEPEPQPEPQPANEAVDQDKDKTVTDHSTEAADQDEEMGDAQPEKTADA